VAKAPDKATVTEVAEVTLLRALRTAESVFAAYRGMGLPTTAIDSGAGGSFDYDIYVDPQASLAVSRTDTPLSIGMFDSASAYAVIPAYEQWDCFAEAQVARVIAQALAMSLDPALHDGVLAMYSSYLASLVAPCAPLETAAIDDLQRHPELAITAGCRDEFSGALLFPWYLDETYGTGRPAGVMTALLTVAGQKTAPTSQVWRNEPDLFDVLRRATRDRAHNLGDLLLDYAIARAFVGNRSDGFHLPDVRRFGPLGRVRFEWSIDYRTLPRRVGPALPVQPTGATYLWLDLRSAPPDAQLLFVADWEIASVFRWALVKIDADGKEVGRLTPPGIFGNSRLQATVADLRDLAGILIVGTNLGSDDRSHPFDPDDGPPYARYYSVWLTQPTEK